MTQKRNLTIVSPDTDLRYLHGGECVLLGSFRAYTNLVGSFRTQCVPLGHFPARKVSSSKLTRHQQTLVTSVDTNRRSSLNGCKCVLLGSFCTYPDLIGADRSRSVLMCPFSTYLNLYESYTPHLAVSLFGLPSGVRRSGNGSMDTPILWIDPLETWLLSLKAKAATQATVDHRCYQIKRLANDFKGRSPWELTADDLLCWVGGKKWAGSTKRSMRSALVGFYGFGEKHKFIASNIADELPYIPQAEPNPRPAPIDLVREAIADSEPIVAQMILLGLHEGMRRGEVAVVHEDDFIEIGSDTKSLVVHGKGGRNRTIPMAPSLWRVLRAQAIENGGWLFPGRIDGHLSPAYVGKLVSRALNNRATMHQLRHLFATELLDLTDNIAVVQNCLGHASPVTTQMYCKPTDKKMQAAVLEHSKSWQY